MLKIDHSDNNRQNINLFDTHYREFKSIYDIFLLNSTSELYSGIIVNSQYHNDIDSDR